MIKSVEYNYVIKTNSYAGNFEREMCAYITGQVGECEVGEDIVEKEIDNIKYCGWYSINILHNFNSSFYSPCNMAQNENGLYNNVEISLQEIMPKDIFVEFYTRAKQYCDLNNINFEGCYVIEKTTSVEEKKIEYEDV